MHKLSNLETLTGFKPNFWVWQDFDKLLINTEKKTDEKYFNKKGHYFKKIFIFILKKLGHLYDRKFSVRLGIWPVFQLLHLWYRVEIFYVNIPLYKESEIERMIFLVISTCMQLFLLLIHTSTI